MMWKKILIAIISLVGTFSVVFALNRDMNASSPVSTSPNKFLMGGITWKILKVEANGTDAYIVPSANFGIAKEFCPRISSTTDFVLADKIEDCLDSANTLYKTNLGDPTKNDAFGSLIMGSNSVAVSNLVLMGDANYTYLLTNYGHLLFETISSEFYIQGGGLGTVTYWYKSAKHVAVTGNGSYIYPVFKVVLVNPPLKSLNFTSTPQSITTYEFSKNVSAGTKVGEISSDDGVAPITYTLVDDPTYPGHSSLFTISNNEVMVGSTDLNAGSYHFKIQAQDANGEPTVPLETDVTITVEKTTPTINFNSTSKHDMKIGDATFSDTITTSNTEATAADITYALTGGVSGVLSVVKNSTNPFQYDVSIVPTFTGSGLPATATLSASIAETANYNAVTTSVNRDIYTYKGISSLTWAPTMPSYQPSDVATIGTKVGTLLAVDGVGPFTYELVKSTDTNYDSINGSENGSFAVTNTSTASGTTVDVTTSAILPVGSYHLQFKVTDTITNEEVYTTGIITVSATAQAALEFKDSPGGTVITNKTIKFDDTNPTVVAEGGSTSNPIQYDFAPTAMQPGNVSASSYASIDSATGVLTPKRTGSIKVQAKRPGNGAYGDITSYLDVRIDPALQTIDFNNTSSSINLKIGSTKLIDATGKIKKSGLVGKGNITYTSSDPSIASVDKATGDVTAIKVGSVTITAELNNTTEANHDPNYDSVSTTKTVNVYKGMTLTWADVSPLVKAEANAIGDKVGSIGVTDNASVPTYTISSNPTTTPKNKDASYFTIVGSGTTADLKLASVISATDQVSHGGNYYVQIDVSDIHGTETIDIVVVVNEADNTISFTDNGSNITALTKKYGENRNTFQLTSTSSNGGSVTYGVDTSDTSGTLSVTGTGVVTVNKTGTAVVSAVVASGNGYTGGTITMNVTVNPGDQSIVFQDTTTLNQPFIANGTFSELAKLEETTLNTASTRVITYTSNTPAVCTIDVAGTITMLTTGTCDINATNSDANWTRVTTNKRISLYDGMGVSFVATGNLQAETVSTGSGASVGSLHASGGIGTKTYGVSTQSDPKNIDANLFKVSSSGVVSFKNAIMASNLVGKYNANKKVYELYVQLETKDSGSTIITTDVIIEVKGAPLNAQFDRVVNGKITEVFGAGKTFTLDLSSNRGNGVVTYQLKSDSSMPSDVLQSVDASGLVSIQHANDATFIGSPLMVEASIPASNGYDEETIEVEVEITKAPQSNFAFKTPNIKIGIGASYTPIFTGKQSSGTITMNSPKPKSVSVSGSDLIAGTSDDVVTITADDSGDRDYQSAVAQATVSISSAPAYSLILTIPSATYGDTGLQATAKAVGSVGSNPMVTWSSSDPTIADIDTSGNIIIYKAGTITISCTRTTTGEPSVTSSATFDIDPKPISVTINNSSKYVGEVIPSFTANIPSADLVGSDTLVQPTFRCNDGSALVKPETKAGMYDINGTYPTASYPNYAITVVKGVLTIKQDTSLASWFHLEGATSKTTLDSTKWLTEDVNVILGTASESAGVYDEISLNNILWGTSHTISKEGINQLDVAFRIKDKNILASSQTINVKIDKTKPVITNVTGTKVNDNGVAKFINAVSFGVFYKPGVEVVIDANDANADTSIQTSGIASIAYKAYAKQNDSFVEIDKGVATLTTTTGKVILSDPGLYRVCAIAYDHAGNASNEYCSELDVKKLDIDIDGDGVKDFQDSNEDGCPDINIILGKDKDNQWIKLNVDRDGDKVPDLNIDSDGDNEGSSPDGVAEINIDSDHDGKPDMNVLLVTKDMWEPSICVPVSSEIPEQYCTTQGLQAAVNIDTGNTTDRYINIDTDGDMKADINITKEGSTTPYLNMVLDKELVWKPNKDLVKDGFAYDTMQLKSELNTDSDEDGLPDLNIDTNEDRKPDLNIDIDYDGIPDVNIDSDGDGLPNLNIDKNGDGVGEENNIDLDEWKPSIKGDGFGTMDIVTKDELEDSGIKVTKPNGVFLANYALRVSDVTTTVSNQLKDEVTKAIQSNQEIRQIYNVSLLKGETSIQPNGNIKVKIPVIQGLKNPKIVVMQKDGSQKLVDAVEENGYYVFESDYLDTVSIISDKDNTTTPPKAEDPETPDITPPSSGTNTPSDKNSSVKGEYTSNAGGALTGDSTSLCVSMLGIGMSGIVGVIAYNRAKRKNHSC